MSKLEQVSVRGSLITRCPNGGIDLNRVVFTFRPQSHVAAERLLDLMGHWADKSVYAETLARDLADAARGVIGSSVVVTVRQIKGHGVEAVASA